MSGDITGRAFRVEGVVQGVGFRWFTRESAVRLSVSGWVGNQPDGSVHGEVFGSAEAVESFLTAVQRGPTLGRVERLEASVVEPRECTGFEIRK